MGVNKIVYGGSTLLDLTADTVTPTKIIEGYTAHDASGTLITGIAKCLPNYIEILEATPQANTTTLTFTYSAYKPLIEAFCYDTNRATLPGSYSILGIDFYNYGSANNYFRYGIITDYQGAEKGNASYASSTAINTSTHTITFGHGSNYYFRAGRTYRVVLVYNATDSYGVDISGLINGSGVNITGWSYENPYITVPEGEPYSTTLSLPDSHFTLNSVSVTMGGTDITSTAYDSTTKKILIPSVIGDVALATTGSNDYFITPCDAVMVEQYNNSNPATFGVMPGNSMGILMTGSASGIVFGVQLKNIITSTGNMYLKADSIEVYNNIDTGFLIRSFFFDENMNQLGSNADFITSSESILSILNGKQSWIGSSYIGAKYASLVIFSSNNVSAGTTIGANFQNLRVQLTNN